MAKPHLAHPSDPALTLCALAIAGPWPQPLPIVDAPDGATCRRCARLYEPPEPAFERSGPYTVPRSTSALTDRGRRAIERSLRGEAPEGRYWPTADAAIRACLTARAEGASVRSPSDMDRGHRVQSSRDPSQGGREHAQIDRLRNVSLALDRAAADVAALAYAAPTLTPEQAWAVMVWRIVGREVMRVVGLRGQRRKGRVREWVGMTGEAAAAEASELFGAEVTERHVSRIVRHFRDRVREALERSGEMRAPAVVEREERGGWDVLSRVRAEVSR